MTPQRLLSLWRERWGKADAADYEEPYAEGLLGFWVERISNASAWRIPGLGVVALLLFAGLTLLLLGVRLTLHNQLWLSLFFLVVSLIIQRYQAQLMALLLMGFAVISSSRYLYWRVDDSLGPALSLDYFFGLGLWVLEIYGAVVFILGIAHALWPARQAAVALPADPAEWPSVSVLVYGAGCSAEDIGRSVTALQNARWPRSKFSLTVIDDIERDALEASLKAARVNYQTYAKQSQGTPAMLNLAVAQSSAELLVIVKAGQTPAEDFLVDSVGWLHEDQGLGLLSTPRHFLLPQLPGLVTADTDTLQAEEFLITRVSLFLKANGVPVEATSPQHHLARRLQDQGVSHACVLEQDQAKWRMHEPFAGRALSRKLWLERVSEAIRVYQPLLQGALLTVPLFYLLTGITPITATPQLWLAYAVPHFLQAYLLHSRVHAKLYLPLWVEVRDAVQSAYLVLVTFFSVSWTRMKRRDHPGTDSLPANQADALSLQTSDWVLAVLHGAALLAGVVKLLYADLSTSHMLVFFMTWSAIIIMLLAAEYAVLKEAQEVARQKQRLMIMPAMVRLPNNRTLTCQTANFPATRLELTVASNLAFALGQQVKVSVFHQLAECAVSACVCKKADSVVTLEIEAANREEFAQFSRAVFARGPDWPAWLPGQHVDRFAPQWLIRAAAWTMTKFAHLIHRFDRKPALASVDNAHMKWKKKA